MNTDRITVMTAIGQTRQHYRQLDRELPAGMVDALARIDEQANRTLPRHDPAGLVNAIDAALTAGKDPATDTAVLAELARKQLAELNPAELFDNLAWQRRGDVLREYAPAIIADLAQVVEQADAVLDKARAAIPNLDTDDTTSVTTMRPAQMALWGEARVAVDHLDRVAQMWHLIVLACRLAPLDASRQPLILADLTPEQLAALDERRALAPVRAGHRLALADVDTYRQRCQRADEYVTEQAAKRAREARTGKRED